MSQQFNRFPTYQVPLENKGTTDRTWYTYWSGLFKGQPTGPAEAVTVGPNPFSYIAPTAGMVLLSGGTVSLVQFSRDGETNYPTGQTQGIFPLAFGDTLIVHYSVKPNFAFVPR